TSAAAAWRALVGRRVYVHGGGGGAAHAHVYRAREQRSAVPDPRNRTETLVAKQHITARYYRFLRRKEAISL
ncbi:hypothetical protein J6590_060469, partial [Homalodisca vitripennis]